MKMLAVGVDVDVVMASLVARWRLRAQAACIVLVVVELSTCILAAIGQRCAGAHLPPPGRRAHRCRDGKLGDV